MFEGARKFQVFIHKRKIYRAKLSLNPFDSVINNMYFSMNLSNHAVCANYFLFKGRYQFHMLLTPRLMKITSVDWKYIEKYLCRLHRLQLPVWINLSGI
jgi:hypothetical protein